MRVGMGGGRLYFWMGIVRDRAYHPTVAVAVIIGASILVRRR